MNCLVLEDQQIFLDLLGSMVESFNEISDVFKAESIEAASNISHHHKIDLAMSICQMGTAMTLHTI